MKTPSSLFHYLWIWEKKKLIFSRLIFFSLFMVLETHIDVITLITYKYLCIYTAPPLLPITYLHIRCRSSLLLNQHALARKNGMIPAQQPKRSREHSQDEFSWLNAHTLYTYLLANANNKWREPIFPKSCCSYIFQWRASTYTVYAHDPLNIPYPRVVQQHMSTYTSCSGISGGLEDPEMIMMCMHI